MPKTTYFKSRALVLFLGLIASIFLVACDMVSGFSFPIASNPSGAEAILDGKSIGKTPLIFTIKPGNHVIELRKDGFQELSFAFYASSRFIKNYESYQELNLTMQQENTSLAVVPIEGNLSNARAINSSKLNDVGDQTKALEAIAEFSERICRTVPIKSRSEELQLSGKANTELKELLSKIAGLGISGGVEYKTAEFNGVLQKDLAALLNQSSDCKQRISGKLIDKLIPKHK